MKTKILIVVLATGLFSTSTILAQEKNQVKIRHEQIKIDHSKMAMDHSKMKMKHDSSKMKMDHSKMEMKHNKMAKKFTCSMHPEVTSDQPGECPKCGMKLTEKKIEMKNDSTKIKMDHSKMEMKHDSMKTDHSKMNHEKMAKTFTCSMHPEVTSDKPGECPKCGMELTEKKMDMKNEDTPNKHKH